MQKRLVRLSKYLSFLLRHGAQEMHLEMDEHGFVSLEAVWDLVERRFPREYTHEDLMILVRAEGQKKRRFERIEGTIRALYGHSRVRPITYPVVEPPTSLYHGTNAQALENIRREGLRSMARQYVHLSLDEPWARKVASRQTSDPLIVHVRAHEAYLAGIAFHHPEQEHYLAVAIPPAFLDLP